MPEKVVPSDYDKMDLSMAMRFDKEVKENFMPAIRSTVKWLVEDYGVKDGVCVEVGSGTAVFAIELCKKTNLTIYTLEKEKPIYEVANINIKEDSLSDRIKTLLGDAHNLPFSDEFADFVISRGACHYWKDKVKVFKEIYRILKKGGLALVGGGFGCYVSDEELERMKSLRDKSLKDKAKLYYDPDLLKSIVEKAGVKNYRIIYDKYGLWAEIKK